MSFLKKASFALAALFLIAGLADQVEARGKRVNQIPNGAAFGCAGCHVDPNGGGARNAFGQMIGQQFLTGAGFVGDVIWGPELAALDADGDGATNGEELGDPAGTWDWQAGDANPGDPDAVTRPWDAESFPPPQPTAVESSTWARVKLLIQESQE